MFEQIDIYCERTDFSYWAEPLNAVSNAAFLIAAFVMWWRLRGARLPMAALLVALLAVIGVGSFLFHTHATRWAALVDVVPIGLFILVYLFAVSRDFLRLAWGWAGVITLGFVPYAAVIVPVLDRLPFSATSNFYWTVPILLTLFAPFVARQDPQTARGMLIGAGILCLSITIRSLDMPICPRLPIGVHYLWHILNAIMLGWMIEVYRRHMLGNRRAAS